jgi:hypothetical protein
MISQLYSSSYCLKEFLRNLQIYISKLGEQNADINTGGKDPTSSLIQIFYLSKKSSKGDTDSKFRQKFPFFPPKTFYRNLQHLPSNLELDWRVPTEYFP